MSDELSVTVNRESAKRELAKRELARRHVIDFSTYVKSWYKPARHHRFVADMLEQVETYIRTGGESGIGRLLIFMPPRHGKSELVSKIFPAWLMGKITSQYQMPCYMITTSYNESRAVENSRAVREIIRSDEYANLFGTRASVDEPVTLSSDSTSVEKWDLSSPYRGGMLAAGVGGGITGFGANLMIFDDLFKDREDAESEKRRETVWEWWSSSAYSRFEPNTAAIGMTTRWHGDDWSGRLLRLMADSPDADRWVVINMPAIWEEPAVPDGMTFGEYHVNQMRDGVWVDREDILGRRPGEALWPEKFGARWMENKKANTMPYDWQSLYQQSPYSKAGNMFKREWLPIVDNPPQTEEIVFQVRYWDKAGTAGGGAYTAGVLLALTRSQMVYVLDAVRGQWSAYERDKQMLRTAQIDQKRPGPMVQIWHEQEPGSGGKDSAQSTNSQFALGGFSAHFETVTGDKVTRALPWSSQAEAGRVRLLRAGWNQDYVEEHVSFPKGRFKDQVDASGGAFSKLINGSCEVGVRWL